MSDQLLLIDDEIAALPAEMQAVARKHSAAFLRRDNPKLVAAIELLIQLGVSDAHIADHCKVSRNVAAAVRLGTAPLSVEQHKKRLMSGLERLGLGIINRMVEAVESGEEIPFKDLGIVLGIGTEKLELLRGNATVRTERVLSPEEEMLRSIFLGAAGGSGKVFEAESLPPNASTAPLPLPPQGHLETAPFNPTMDNISPAYET
jgi:hypothetical protein